MLENRKMKSTLVWKFRKNEWYINTAEGLVMRTKHKEKSLHCYKQVQMVIEKREEGYLQCRKKWQMGCGKWRTEYTENHE